MRPKILVPPGIGDSYWTFVKLPAFLKKHGLEKPFISIFCKRTEPHSYAGELRSVPFFEMLTFVESTGLAVAPDPAHDKMLTEAYTKPGRTVFENVKGHDYFISYIGHLHVGGKIQEADDLECDWYPELHSSEEQEEYKRLSQEQYGRYIVYYFPFYGMYRQWLKDFNVFPMIESLNEISVKTGCTPVFIGREWDRDKNPVLRYIIRRVPGAVDLLGKTSLHQVFGLIRGSRAFVGNQAGIGMMANILGVKTMLIWNKFINVNMALNSMPPSSWGVTYFPVFTHELNVSKFVTDVSNLVGES